MILTRIYEKLMGLPHQKHHAERVKRAAEELSQDVKSLTQRIERYREEDDPLVALMQDIYNDSETRKSFRLLGHNGHGHNNKNGSES